MRSLAAMLTILCLAAGCASSSEESPMTSGVKGAIMAGPQCPVQRADEPCPDEPVAGAEVTLVTVGGTTIIARATSDEEGSFEVAARPGRYVLSAASGTLTCQPQTVTVSEDSFTTQDISCDTGIR